MPVMLERWNDDKMDALDAKVDGVDVRLTRVETKVDEGFEQVDKRFERVDKRFERVEGELLEQRREMKAGFDKLGDRMTHALLAVIGAGATIATAVIAAPHL
jgi:hypothetical protein